MNDERIPKIECDLLSKAVNRIVSTEVLEKDITDQLPLTDDLSDANKIYQGKVSVLFVDMRESTKLPDKFSMEQLVKIYRSYIRTIVQAIRYSGGIVKDFMGDGVLAVFIDDQENKSEDKAVHAARYITTAIDKLLNPVLDQKIKHRISCGIGIHTGDVSLSKVGMKGKEQDDEAESEFGIAWIGNSTNLACKFSGAVSGGTIFISPSTYAALSNLEDKQEWKNIKISKGSNVLIGYIAKQYYLPLEENIEPCVAASCSLTLSLADELRVEYQKQLADILRKSEELGRKEQELKDKEEHINAKELEVERKESENSTIEKKIYEREFRFYCNVLDSGHCKTAYVKEMREDFWEEHLQGAIIAGKKIGKSEHEVKQKISYAMVSIYGNLEMWNKAYDFLVEQATGYAWLSLSVVQRIVRKVGYCNRLKDALYIRLAKNDLDLQQKEEFEKIKDWIVFDYEL
jgi:class 3 adenylate cyclase